MIIKNRLIILLGAITVIIIDSLTGLYGYKTNFTLLIIYYSACIFNRERALIFAGLIGLIIDTISLKLIGPNILGFGVSVMIIVFVRIKIINWTQLFNFILGFSITIISGLINYLSFALFDTLPIEISKMLYILLIEGTINGVITYLFSVRDE